VTSRLMGCTSAFDPNTKSHASHARQKELRLLRSYALRIIQFLTLYICSLSCIYSTICNAHVCERPKKHNSTSSKGILLSGTRAHHPLATSCTEQSNSLWARDKECLLIRKRRRQCSRSQLQEQHQRLPRASWEQCRFQKDASSSKSSKSSSSSSKSSLISRKD